MPRPEVASWVALLASVLALGPGPRPAWTDEPTPGTEGSAGGVPSHDADVKQLAPPATTDAKAESGGEKAPRAKDGAEKSGRTPKPAPDPSAARPRPKPDPKPSRAEEDGTQGAGEEPTAAAKPKAELTPELLRLRDQVRRTLSAARQSPLDTKYNTVTDLIVSTLPLGCESESLLGGPGGRRINTITCLCWNYPCAGRRPLTVAHGRIAARIGYGLQTQRGQLLAALAFARVPDDYPCRVGDDERTVADLVASEKLNCGEGIDSSHLLVGLTYYLPGDASWKNRLGETWSLERLVDMELDGPINDAPDGGLHRLMGLSFAVQSRLARKQKMSEPFVHARDYVIEYQDFAFRCQNEDGTWHPTFFAAKGPTRDTVGALRATGHITRWLAYSLPEGRLVEPDMVKAVKAVATLAGRVPRPGGGAALSPQLTSTAMHALHALAIYDARVFKPHDDTAP